MCQEQETLPTNKFNTITLQKEKNIVIKTGNPTFLRGECFFYQNIPSHVREYFPQFLGANDMCSELVLEYIDGTPVYTMYKMRMLNNSHLSKIFSFIDKLHEGEIGADPEMATTISKKDISANYIDKLQQRFQLREEYPFPDREVLQKLCLSRLETYLALDGNVVIKPFVHGDLWFSNMMFDKFQNLKVLDMKGQVNNILTTAGDRMYDYGKLYQSILGYDTVLYNHFVDEIYRNEMHFIFEAEMVHRNINLEHLKIVTFSLVMGTFYFIESKETKLRVWAWIKQNLALKFL